MIALSVVVRDVLVEQLTQMRLAQRHHLRQALVANRAHESLCKGVQGWTACRQSHAFHAAAESNRSFLIQLARARGSYGKRVKTDRACPTRRRERRTMLGVGRREARIHRHSLCVRSDPDRRR